MKKLALFVLMFAMLCLVMLAGNGQTLADQSPVPICQPDQWSTICLPWRATPPPPATETPAPAREHSLIKTYLPIVAR